MQVAALVAGMTRKDLLTMIRNLLAAAALAAVSLGTAGCNTVQGVGEDIKSVGRAGERAID